MGLNVEPSQMNIPKYYEVRFQNMFNEASLIDNFKKS